MNFCPNCGFANRPDAKFCKHCGALMSTAAPSFPSLPAAPPGPQSSGAWPAAPAMFPTSSIASAALVSPATGQRYPLSACTLVGRGNMCQVVLSDSSVSTQHATLTETNGQWQITDSNSRNGTWINRVRIVSPCGLHSGDEVMLGTLVLRFEANSVGATSGSTTLIDPAQFPQPMASAAPTVLPVAGRASGGGAGVIARGTIKLDPREWQDQPPTDGIRTAITVLVTLTFIGGLLSFTFAAVVTAGVLICLGGAVLIPLLLMLWAPVQLIFNSLIGGLKDDKPVTLVNFQIDDELTGFPADITFVRKRGTGGGLAKFDKVEIWGKQQGGASITASKVRVIERQNVSTSAYIPIRQPWPAWVLLLVIAAIVLIVILIAGGLQ